MTQFIKRINKEIDYFIHSKYLFDNYNDIIKNKFSKLSFNFYETCEYTNNNNIDYVLFIYYNNYLIYKLLANSSYPFKPYKIIYYRGFNDYFSFLINLNKKIDNANKHFLIFFYKILYQKNPKFLVLNEGECYCCSSILCGYNWAPSFTLSNILIEDIELCFIKKYINPLQLKLIISIYENFVNEFKLNNDIFDLIIEKIIN